MPPGVQLFATEVEMIRRWIDEAAVWPSEAETQPNAKARVRPWSFERIQAVDTPVVAQRELNRDMPFDQFTIEQMAGHLLPNATLEQKLATGFHRNTVTSREGGIPNNGVLYLVSVLL